MLRLHNINKDYIMADQKVEALKCINLAFRKNEFVSILGPSGCGKTTTLNIIGGLDKYTSGDLYINGISTKDFNDRDWDIYRNHRVGFIFQSYNLIPQQTILGNVELSLTIAGVSKEERIKKAKAALDRVGLKGQYNKKPNQLSGGQCQRVAIARALVNEPEILLADEPTGALDTATSVQIMELIKEISKDKLVIMVTHNPLLAEQYSSRIIKLLDGEVVSDTNPLTAEVEINEVRKEKLEAGPEKRKEKAKMSLKTAFILSLKNLFTKKKRTALTCIAGSIGIIGISMVLAVSSGVKGFIADMQDDMLSGNPIKITEQTLDMNAMLSEMTTAEKVEVTKDSFINVYQVINELMAQDEMLVKNNITKDYVDYVLNLDEKDVACINLGYGIDVGNNIYTDFKNSSTSNKENISLNTIKEIYTSVLKETEYSQYASYVTNLATLFAQAPNNPDYISSQYDIRSGKIATEENEIMVVLDNDSTVVDLVLAELGYYTQEEFIYSSDVNSDKNNPLYKTKFSYDEILGKTFTWYSNDQIYEENQGEDKSYFPFKYNSNSKDITTKGEELKIVGILEPKEDVSYGALTGGFYYTEGLTKKMLSDAKTSKIYDYFIDNNITSFNTAVMDGEFILIEGNVGIPYQFDFTFNGVTTTKNSFVGSYVDYSFMGDYVASMGGSESMGSSQTSVVTYTISLRELGGNDVANSISIYPLNFDTKSNVTSYLDKWNEEGDITVNDKVLKFEDRDKIKYSDPIAVIISMMNSMIDMVTYALISFTALSLVVSCVMIAIITYVSVMERIKEIGVIRSLGGRKRDVSHLFNAETLIIGSISGLFGIGVTYLLSLFINILINQLAGIKSIAALPFYQALIMIILSIVLTLVSGLIPARSAAKKDPVTALRSE